VLLVLIAKMNYKLGAYPEVEDLSAQPWPCVQQSWMLALDIRLSLARMNVGEDCFRQWAIDARELIPCAVPPQAFVGCSKPTASYLPHNLIAKIENSRIIEER
jgi:hypothetical protein